MFLDYRTNFSFSKQQAPVEDLMNKYFSLPDLNSFYAAFFQIPEEPSAPKPTVRKYELVNLILKLLRNPEERQQWMGRVSPSLLDVYALVTHAGSLTLGELEEITGEEILESVPAKGRYCGWGGKDFVWQTKDCYFLLLVKDYSDNYYYSSGRSPDEKAFFEVKLPPAFAVVFREIFPRPQGSEIVGQPDWQPPGPPKPSKNLTIVDLNIDAEYLPSHTPHAFNACAYGWQDLMLASELVQTSEPDLSASHILRAPFVKKLSGILEGGEFFPEQKKMPKHQFLRAELLGNLAFHYRTKVPFCTLAEAGNQEKSLRDLAKHLPDMLPLLWPVLMPHSSADSYCEIVKVLPKKMTDIFCAVPAGQWLAWPTMHSYLLYNNIAGDFLASLCKFKWNLESHLGYRASHFESAIMREVCLYPMIKGLAFLLAALGWAEISYTEPPAASHYRLSNYHWLSTWNGFLALRLTPLGLFAFGLQPNLPQDLATSSMAQFEFSTEQLLVRVSNITAATESFLNTYLEQLQKGFYRFDRRRFFKNCHNSKDLALRVQEFLKRVPAQLPPNWQLALQQFGKKTCPIVQETEWIVFRVDLSSPLATLIRSDAVLRRTMQQMRGGRVAVSKNEWTEAKQRLVELGFYVDI